ncbi:hypothetical protein Tco_0109279 [Tanacetum coccineum]
MLVAIETVDRTPRPIFGFTRKLFSNMKLKWEGEAIPLTPPMLAIAAAGNDAADEENVAAHAVAGSPAEAHPVPYPPPFSPVREPTPERQPETEWVVPIPVSPITDWRPWPSVPAHSPIRDPTYEPASLPTPSTQTVIFEEPLAFGPAPRPAGYVDPDVLEPILCGPQPRPSDFVDPDLEEPVIFGPQLRPDNYIEPADIDNLASLEDDTIHGGFHEESPVGPNDTPTPTADAAGRAEDPTLLTSLSAKLDRCIGRIDSLETELGTSKKIIGGAILTLVSRVKKLERTVKQLKTARFGGDAPATEGDVNIQDDVDLEGLSRMASEALGHDQPAVPSEHMEEREEEEVPLRRKRSVYRRARTEFHTSAFAQFHAPLSTDVLPQADISESAGPSVGADKGKAPMPDLEIPAEFLAEDAQARQRLEEEQASARLVQQLQAEDLAQADVPIVSEQRAKELDALMLRMTETDWLTLMMQVGTNPALARELLGADVNEDNFIERMTAIKERKKRALADLRYRALKGKPLKQSEVTQMMRNLVKNQWCAAHNGTITMKAVKAMSKQQLIEEYENICRRLEKDRLLSAQYNLFRPKPVISEPPSKRQRVDRDTSQPSGVPAASTQHADDPDSAGGGSFKPAGSATPLSGSAAPTSAGGVFGVPDSLLLLFPLQHPMDSAASNHELEISPFADSTYDEERAIGLSRVAAARTDTDIELLAELLRIRGSHLCFWCSCCGCWANSQKMRLFDPRENRRHKNFFYLKELLPHVYREDLLLLRRQMNRYFRLNPDVDFGLDLWVIYPIRLHCLKGSYADKSKAHSSIPHLSGCFVDARKSVIQTIQDACGNPIVSCLCSFCLHCTTNGFQLTMANSRERVWLTIANGFGVYLKSVDVVPRLPKPGCCYSSRSLLTEIDSADYVSSCHVLVPYARDRDRIS